MWGGEASRASWIARIASVLSEIPLPSECVEYFGMAGASLPRAAVAARASRTVHTGSDEVEFDPLCWRIDWTADAWAPARQVGRSAR
jgi:hypothetical protein